MGEITHRRRELSPRRTQARVRGALGEPKSSRDLGHRDLINVMEHEYSTPVVVQHLEGPPDDVHRLAHLEVLVRGLRSGDIVEITRAQLAPMARETAVLRRHASGKRKEPSANRSRRVEMVELTMNPHEHLTHQVVPVLHGDAEPPEG